MLAESQRFELLATEMERVDGQRPDRGPLVRKHRRMSTHPLRFLRGAAQIYYADLAQGRIRLPQALLSTPLTCIQGDCHFSNFGFFTEEGSHGDRVIWAPNDFDDAAVGHAAFDLLRFAVSVFLVADYCGGVADGRYGAHDRGRAAGVRALTLDAAAEAAMAFLVAYRRACEAMVDEPEERDRPLERFGKRHVLAKPLRRARRRAAGGDRFATKSTLAKSVRRARGELHFRRRAGRLEAVDAELHARLCTAFRPHVDDDILDIARRLGAGTGSMNVRRYYLLVGPRGSLGEKRLRLAHVVEVKQQRQAAMVHHFPRLNPVNTLSPARLTVDCQRRMARRPDLVLGDVAWDGAHWLVRSRHHARLSVAPAQLLSVKKPALALAQIAAACGETLARAHARGDRRSTRFEAAMADALSTSSVALVDIARSYAQRSIDDRALLRGVLDARA